MARFPRICFPGALYHVTGRGNERRSIARDDDDRQRFLRTVAGMVDAYGVVCHAYVLMDNHYHLVLETPLGNLSRAIRHLNGVYTQQFNRRHDRVGHLFQGRFFSVVIDKDSYLLNVCRYVVLNPVRARLVAAAEDWVWSSYRATAGLAVRPRWLTVDALLACFGTRRAVAVDAYCRFVAEGAGQPAPWPRTRPPSVLGDEGFVEAVRARVGDSLGEALRQRFGQQQGGPPLVLENLLRRVGHAYGIDPASLLRPSRPVSEARRVAIFAARRAARMDVRAIAERFGVGSPAISRTVRGVVDRLRVDRAFEARVRASLGNGKT